MTGVVVSTRDAAVSQLDARALPKTEVRADVAPLLAVALGALQVVLLRRRGSGHSSIESES